MRIAVYCGANVGTRPAYEETAKKLGQWMAKNGHILVFGGGGVGLMGVVSNAILDQGGQVIGIIPQFLVEHEVANRRLTNLIVVEDMRTRKQAMIDRADAFIALPGGPGTLEEIAEVISWARLGKLTQPCILFNVEGYYDHMAAQLDRMVEDGFLLQVHRDNILVADSIEAINEFICNYKPLGLYGE